MLRPLKDVKQATQYFDGLGRPLQTVIKQGSLQTGGSATDMVSSVVYDGFGREAIKYLPYAEATAADGLFKSNPFTPQVNFYNTQLNGQTGETSVGVSGLNWAYGKTNFEASPLSRVNESYAPGVSWVGSEGNVDLNLRHRVQMKYWINTVADEVKIWNVTDVTGGLGTYSISGAYPAGVLYKNVTEDETGKQVIEFKDKEGQVILKKVQIGTAAGVADDGLGRACDNNWLCTYYVYDDLNRLRAVIQPEGVRWLKDPAHNWTLSAADYNANGIVAEQFFRYEYDYRNRMIIKKVPGAGEVWMVYDARDRLVLTQDANLRLQGKWMYTTYENDLNRPVSTGLWTNANDRAYHQGLAGTSTAYPTVSGASFEELTVTFYDNYLWRAAYGNPLSASYDASFDSYFQTVSNVNWPYAQANSATTALKGLTTGSRVKVLGTSTYLYTVNFYDNKGRVIQVQATNYSGGTDIVTTQYSWAGQPLVIINKTQKAGTNPQTTVIVTQNSYDDLGRLVKVEKKQSNTLVNSGTMTAYKTITENEYDKLGQVKTKKLGKQPDGVTPLETLAYDYNIRGWMLGMNRSYLTNPGQSGSARFGFELGYDKLQSNAGNDYASPQFNGNISGMTWKSDGDDIRRKYDFSYDAANRLMKGDFKQDNGGTAWNNTLINYNMQMGNGTDPATAYDANGNIKAMTQYGWKLGGVTTNPIDNLTYNYYSNSNKLKNVIDASNDPGTKLGDFRTSVLHPNQIKNSSTVDYTYDLNGNLRKDLNKDIGTASAEDIVYNHLNLPQTISVRTTGGAVKGTITYTYDAAGNKLQKTVTETGQPAKATLYLGGGVYENDVLQFLGHEEGRMRPGSTGFSYDYLIKDHLGNIRMVLTEEQMTTPYVAATLEPSTIGNESIYYGNLTNTQYDKPTWFTDALYSGSTKVARLKNAAGTQKVGPNMILKVMAGDSYNIRVASGWSSATSAVNNSTNVLTDLMNLLTNDLANKSGGKATQAELQNASSGLNSGITEFMNQQTAQGTQPKAYINWILLDEQFRVAKNVYGSMIANGYSGFDPVGASGSAKIHTLANLTIAKSGYLYIYTSNEATNIDVFFDNLQVTHTRGAILEETHYYPFGLTMAGISSKALDFGNPKNKEKTFQGQRFDDDLDLNWVQFKWRNHDPQIGRFVEIDPLSEKYEYNSSYAFSENEVTSHVELEGLEKELATSGAIATGAATAGATAAGVAVGVATVFFAYAKATIEEAEYRTSAGQVRMYTSSGTYIYIDDPLVKQAMQSNQTPDANQAQNSTPKRSASDQKLIDDAKQQKAKEDLAKTRAQQRQQQSTNGKAKEGKSNQGTKGSHNSGNQSRADKEKHDKAEARRAREQAAAEKKKEETKTN
ncbi:MAG: hypothetical protein HZA79_02775 [Sphingobacteriales bacterium]|nr:hypothetical protein [Sphingobacteriales bacterium]